MKLSVRVRGEWFQVPCKTGEETIAWLGEEALRRYQKLKPATHVPNRKETVASVRRTQGGAILDPSDFIGDVLDDNDFVSVVLDTDRPNPVTERAEIKYVSEQMYPFVLNTRLTQPQEKLSSEAELAVKRARDLVEQILKDNKVVYGITTGFGKFARTIISDSKLEELQTNLIRSHSAGVGHPLPPTKTRMLLALRINVLAKGYSGISLNTLKQLIEAFNVSCLPWVPEKGTVGASGDLAPLAHLALGMLGEGKMWSPKTGWGNAKYVLEAHNLTPVKLGPKEGIALINGTQLITSITAEALERADTIARQADVVAALTLEVLKGTSKAFDSDVHKLRHHKGQNAVAHRIRALLHSDTYPSEIAGERAREKFQAVSEWPCVAKIHELLLNEKSFPSQVGFSAVQWIECLDLTKQFLSSTSHESHRFCNRVQDAYTLRCCPQVHGIVHDTLHFVRSIITDEINSATDNPVSSTLFIENDNHYMRHLVLSDRGEIISAGNFHGEYPAKAADYLAIGIHEMSSMSERRIERLVNPALSELPAFLVKEGGLNSGFMMAHCTAASLVSENKVLCHPASVDSLTTSAGTEDHVSMGGFAARKALMVVENVERVIAIELLAACQAIEFLRPMKTTTPLEEVIKVVRSVVSAWDKDRFMAPDIDAVTELLKDGKIWHAVRHHIEHYHRVQDVETRVFSPSMSFTGSGPPKMLKRSVTNGRAASPNVQKRTRTSSRT
ncbi:hypothetical protein SK128_018842 [Halocaridina rubra]|uniref:Par3/HAL N-terminal domain-containing protein n=1 Tax=Halocaridina rubra TaxID=373956 RepID=A0AAN8WI15_HALRR